MAITEAVTPAQEEKRYKALCPVGSQPSGNHSPHLHSLTLGPGNPVGTILLCFSLSWAQFVTFLSPFFPLLFLFSPWSALLSLLPTSPGLWLILLLFLVCGIFFGSLCLQRGAGQPKVFRASGKPPSTAVSPVMQEVSRGTPGPESVLSFPFHGRK